MVERGPKPRRRTWREKALSVGVAAGIGIGGASAAALISPSEAFARTPVSSPARSNPEKQGKKDKELAASHPKKVEQQLTPEVEQQIQTVANHIAATQKLTTLDLDTWQTHVKPDGEQNRLTYKGIEITHLSLFAVDGLKHFFAAMSLFEGRLTFNVKGSSGESVTLALATLPVPANTLHPKGRMVVFPFAVNLNVQDPALGPNQSSFTDLPYGALYPSSKNVEIGLGRVLPRDEFLADLDTHVGEPLVVNLFSQDALTNTIYKTTPGPGIGAGDSQLGNRDASFGIETNPFFSLFQRIQAGTTGLYLDMDKAIAKGVKSGLFYVAEKGKNNPGAAAAYIKNLVTRITAPGTEQNFLQSLFKVAPLASVDVFDKGVISGSVLPSDTKI